MHRPIAPLLCISLLSAGLILTGCGNDNPPGDEQPEAVLPPAETPEETAPANRDIVEIRQAADAGNWLQVSDLSLKKLLENPQNVEARYYLGWAYAETKQWDKAAPELKQVTELDPGYTNAWSTLGWVYAEQKKWPESIAASKKALEQDPNLPYAHANLGWAFAETGETPKAIVEYEKAVALNPKLDTAMYSMGVAYCSTGNPTKAKDIRQKLELLNPDLANKLDTHLKSDCKQQAG